MSNELGQLLVLIRGAWQRRWLLLGSMALVCSVGWPVVYLLPDKYEVTAKVYLDTQSVLKPLLRGLAVDSDVTQQTAQILRRTLLSRPNLEKVARKTDLDLEAKTPEALELTLRTLAEKIEVIGGGNDQIYTISYQNKDPQRATRVVEELLTLFVESALGATRTDTSSAQRFLDEQIKEYEARLEAAEERLKDFKRKNVGLMPEEGRNYFSQISSATARLAQAELDLKEAVNKRNELDRQLAEVRSTSSAVVAPQAQDPIDQRIAALQARLDELLLQYTVQHPDVISVRRTIAELEQRKAQEGSSPSMVSPQNVLDKNPIYQELKVAMGKAEAEVAALQVRVKQYQESVAYLKKMVDTMPTVEAELARLNRDYDINRQNYEEMVRRRESAKISSEADKSADEVKFKVIDPPRVPLVPVGPNRPLLLSAVLMAGLGAALGVIWMMMQLRPTFDSWRTLKEATGFPVFGTVSMALTARQRVSARWQTVSFVVASSILLLAYAALLTIQIFGARLGALVGQ